MTVKQTAVRLEVSSGTVYALVAAGRLRCHRVGLGRGAIRIAEEHLAEYLKTIDSGREVKKPPIPTGRLRLKHLRLD